MGSENVRKYYTVNLSSEFQLVQTWTDNTEAMQKRGFKINSVKWYGINQRTIVFVVFLTCKTMFYVHVDGLNTSPQLSHTTCSQFELRHENTNNVVFEKV